jgi:hypothetical protein
MLCLPPYKIRQVKTVEESNYKEEETFVTGFYEQYMAVFSTQNLHFFTNEAWFHLSGYINAQSNRYGSNINL